MNFISLCAQYMHGRCASGLCHIYMDHFIFLLASVYKALCYDHSHFYMFFTLVC
jgi:hypothetical protein